MLEWHDIEYVVVQNAWVQSAQSIVYCDDCSTKKVMCTNNTSTFVIHCWYLRQPCSLQYNRQVKDFQLPSYQEITQPRHRLDCFQPKQEVEKLLREKRQMKINVNFYSSQWCHYYHQIDNAYLVHVNIKEINNPWNPVVLSHNLPSLSWDLLIDGDKIPELGLVTIEKWQNPRIELKCW